MYFYTKILKMTPNKVFEKIGTILEEKIEIAEEDLETKVNISLEQDSLIKKIHENKVQVITNNKWLKKILLFYLNARR